MPNSVEINNKIKKFKKIISVSGDKSISIRWVLFSSLANGVSKAKNLLLSEDVLAAIKTIRKLGIRSEFVKVAKDESENLLEVNIQKIEDFGNFKLLTANMGNLTIKSKVNRETEIPAQNVKLYFPADKCCVYEDSKIV